MTATTIIPWLAVLAFFALIAFVVRRDAKATREAEPKVEPSGLYPFPCILEGVFSCPDRAVAIAARNASLFRKGFGVEQPDDPDNNAHRNNKVLGGGTPYGGIYLSGSFRFDIDANGQAKPDSYIKIFSDEKFSVSGGVEANGKVGMASTSAGVSISGLVKEGKARIVVAESGTAVDTNPSENDPVWNQLSQIDKDNIEGNTFGSRIEYVHGVGNLAYVRS
jgi:hypothetical protein